MRSFSKKEALAFGWQRFKERPFFLVGLVLLTTIISGITGSVADQIDSGAASAIVNLLDFAIQIIIGMGMTLILLRVYDQVETDYGDIVEPLRLFWKYLVMTVLVLAVVLLGFVIFIIPGIIAAIALSFASYLIIDRNMGPIESIKESLNITHGHRWNLFIFGLIVFFLNIVGAMFFGVGLLVTVPVSALATVHVYRWLLEPPEDRGIEVSWVSKTLSVIAVLAMLAIGLVALFLIGSNLAGVGGPEIRDVQRRADLVQVQLGVALYQDLNNAYPTRLTELVPEYLPQMPVDPQTGESYDYTLFAGGTDYEVCAMLEAPEDGVSEYCEFGLEFGGQSETSEPDESTELEEN